MEERVTLGREDVEQRLMGDGPENRTLDTELRLELNISKPNVNKQLPKEKCNR